MENEDQISVIIGAMQSDIDFLKEKLKLMQADIADLKSFKDGYVAAIKHKRMLGLTEPEPEAPEALLDADGIPVHALETAKKYWKEALNLLNGSFSDVVYTAWIEPLIPLSYDNGELILKCTREFAKSTVNQRYLPEITRCVKAVTGADAVVRIVSPNDLKPIA